jgi:hypothetical protein
MVVKVDYNSNPLNETNKIQLGKKVDRFVDAIVKNKSKSILDWIIVDNIAIKYLWKPVFLKNSEKYGGILSAWKEKKIEEKGERQRA